MAAKDDPPTDPKMLRQRADHFRQLGMSVNDARAMTAAKELAEQYEALAAELEARSENRIDASGKDGTEDKSR